MKKNGMTLVELIAVIAILGVLSIIATPAILGIRTMVLENTLDSKIAMITTGALEYAMDHINDVPSVVDQAETLEDVPCICDCTRKVLINGNYVVPGRYDNVPTADSCDKLCRNYKADDKSTDGSFKKTSISGNMTATDGKKVCAAPNVNCLLITVRDLITKGYVIGDKDNKEILENPFNNEPLNTKIVCVRYNNNDAYNRKLIAYVIGEEQLRK